GERPSQSDRGAERAAERLETGLLHSGHEDGVLHEAPDPLLERQQVLLREEVDLVEDEEAWPVADAKLLEHLLDDHALLFPSRLAGVDDVEKQVSFGRLFQRGSKGRHEMVRELPDETDRVGYEHARLADVYFTRKRVERREQAVFDEDVSFTREAGQD